MRALQELSYKIVKTDARDEICCRGAAEKCIRIRGAFQRLDALERLGEVDVEKG